MKNVIETFYNGKSNFSERIFQHDKRYRNQMKKQCDSAEKLCASLSREQRHLFDEYCDQRNQTDTYIHCKIFRSGLRIGAKLLLEITK